MSTRIKKICGAFFLFGIVVFGALLTLDIQTRSVTTEPEMVVFEVKQGESSKDIIVKLRQENLIKSQFFTNVKKMTMPNSGFYVGTYHLNRNWSTGEILRHMSKIDNVDGSNTVSILLKEGSWAKDFARLIGESTSVSSNELLNLWNDPVYVGQLVSEYQHIPNDVLENQDAVVLLEGFLYPDTYDFYRKTTAEDITKKILDNGEAKYLSIKEEIDASSYDYYDLMILASIVEYEASEVEDMRMVAGVFQNRLDIGMKLQSSVTICYSLYEFDSWEECESAKNNQIDNPYNTYRYEGLPPGPILNPSLKAIKAVLEQTPSNYLFFVADVYGDGKVYYTETFEEHDKLVKKYLGG